MLAALCWLFYWRLLTPNPVNQLSLVEGDFSGQFVPFAHYQAIRLQHGEIPLWNPYNYGGHPFLADTQSAVFYPPRLITIGLLNLSGGSTPQRMYYALQDEMILHTLIASWLMYILMRRLTLTQMLTQSHSVVASLISGLTFAYSGYLTGYPQLQLAVMEAGIWLPLALLGIHEATRPANVRWWWFVVSGVALALSFTAGHSQTTLFFIYVNLAYLGWRVLMTRRSWIVFAVGAILFGIIGSGLAAVQLLPAWEYLGQTTRNALNFDALGNGFPLYDVIQMIMPGIVSLWSPLYVGIVGLALALYAIWRRAENSIFWAITAVVALSLSFGHGTILYDIFYNLVPGFSLFREQERSAYVITVALSILAGLGTIAILSEKPSRSYRLILWGIVSIVAILGATLFINWLVVPGTDGKRLGLVAFSLLTATLSAFLLTTGDNFRWRPLVILGLIIFELFSFGRTTPNLEAKPASAHLQTPTLVSKALADTDGIFRVDGVMQNYGTLYGLADIQGISPLRPASIDRLLKIPPGRAWEVLAVRYVFTPNNELPAPSTISASIDDPANPLKLHRLSNPRPFARLVYKTWIEADDNQALGILSEPAFDAAHTVILPTDLGLALPAQSPNDVQVQVVNFAPESITIRAQSSTAAILDVALVNYPGWQATIDGQSTPLLRADTALTAVPLPSGDHTVQFSYQPRSFTVGVVISLSTLVVLVIGSLFGLSRITAAARYKS